MASKKYWTGLEDLHQTEEFVSQNQKEFSSDLPVEEFVGNDKLAESSTGRRDFLKFLGFSVTAAAVAACETPVIKSIPYVNKPEEITPGVANYYASSFYDGGVFASILVKTREGRPIHITGNKKDGLFGGAIVPSVNASVLSLYNSARLQAPTISGNTTTWSKFDAALKKDLLAANGEIAILSESVISPSGKNAIAKFSEAISTESRTVNHYQVDAVSYSALADAVEKAGGERFVPMFDFGKAHVIVSVAADFLSTWLNPTQFENQYKEHRNPEDGKMSKHYQFESNMSLTGSNADKRITVKPSEEFGVLAAIHNHIAAKVGESSVSGATAELTAKTKKVAKDLMANRGKSLVVAGANDLSIQTLALKINKMLGNMESTVLTTKRINLNNGSDKDLASLEKDIKSGAVKALIVLDTNPVYLHGAKWASLIKKVPTSVAISEYNDETASLCKYVAAKSNALEAWGDFEPVTGQYALAQPTINKLYNTRNQFENFTVWAGINSSYLDFIKQTWMTAMSAEGVNVVFGDFWNKTLHDGAVDANDSLAAVELNPSASGLKSSVKSSDLELTLYQNALGSGRQANNPWLQELPDAITKVTWDNYITMAPSDVESRGFNTYIGEASPATEVKLTVGGKEIVLPVYPCPGQKPGTVGIALGYGRGEQGGDLGKSAYQTAEYGGYIMKDDKKQAIGKNAFALLSNKDLRLTGVTIEATGNEYPLACTQTHHTIMGRESILKETSLATFVNGKKDDYNHGHKLAVHEDGKTVKKPVSEIDLWAEHPVEKVHHRWGMAIDLTKCLGCGACITACHSENNVPVVGKDEVRRSRDMHWLRIDRYFSSSEDDKKHAGEDFSYAEMENPDENPTVTHMPMMCQHCNHAPCETVCPVAATTHSNEGLNQMTYNRCIGTRYCANNCPYKVRRFNWFNYKAYKKFSEVNPTQDTMGRMVLNPDVTVRSRGVMEKCSLCVQRIQAGKLEAKKAGHPVEDGSIQTACSESCSMDAITFGDLNDTQSMVAQKSESDRAYQALEEVGVKPNIYYMVKVRNTEESHNSHH